LVSTRRTTCQGRFAAPQSHGRVLPALPGSTQEQVQAQELYSIFQPRHRSPGSKEAPGRGKLSADVAASTALVHLNAPRSSLRPSVGPATRTRTRTRPRARRIAHRLPRDPPRAAGSSAANTRGNEGPTGPVGSIGKAMPESGGICMQGCTEFPTLSPLKKTRRPQRTHHASFDFQAFRRTI